VSQEKEPKAIASLAGQGPFFASFFWASKKMKAPLAGERMIHFNK